MKPNSDNPARNAARRNAASDCDVFLRTPISGIAVRCAYAKNGHAPAEPAISLMKSRRLIACPLGSGQGIVATQTRTGKGPAHVRFTPESGHVQCKSLCLLWAKSGHYAVQQSIAAIGACTAE